MAQSLRTTHAGSLHALADRGGANPRAPNVARTFFT
jgi:hypothetical protein